MTTAMTVYTHDKGEKNMNMPRQGQNENVDHLVGNGYK